jgi:hypothetical protein
MQVRPTDDEYDYSLDPDQPIYRVRVWARAQPPLVVTNVPEEQRGWVPTTWTLSEVVADEVLEWACKEAHGREYEVHVCSPYDDGEWTWIRLYGANPNATYFDDGEVFQATFPDHDQ